MAEYRRDYACAASVGDREVLSTADEGRWPRTHEAFAAHRLAVPVAEDPGASKASWTGMDRQLAITRAIWYHFFGLRNLQPEAVATWTFAWLGIRPLVLGGCLWRTIHSF
jgi:hypothetical protein